MNKSLGIALDDDTDPQAPREVLIEIMAAAYERGSAREHSLDLMTGWRIHQFHGESANYGDLDPSCSVAVAAGWLAREMSMFRSRNGGGIAPDSEDRGWPWDPTRPVAGQYEEWLVKSSYVASHGIHVTEQDHASPDQRLGLPVWPEDQSRST